MKYFYQSIHTIKLFLFSLLCYKIGFIYALILTFLTNRLYLTILSKIFKLEPLSAGDLNFMWCNFEERYNIMSFLTFEDFDTEILKNHIIEKGIKNIPKLRSRIIFKFFEWYWKEIPTKEVIKNIQIIKNDKNYCFNSKEDLEEYGNRELPIRMDFEKNLPYKFIIIQNENAKIKNLLVLKFDHAFTDGIGYMMLMCGLADNFSMDLFPRATNRKKMNFYDYLIFSFSIPYFIIFTFYNSIMNANSGPTPFKVKENLKKTGLAKIHISKLMDFEEIAKISKKLNITFNDLMMSIISSSTKKFCEENYHRVPKFLSTTIPVGYRSSPKTLNDIVITNGSTAMACLIKIISDPVKESKIVHNQLLKNVRNIPFIILTKNLIDFIMKYLPNFVIKKLIRNTCEQFDFAITNIPGPKTNLYYAGYKVTELIGISTPGFSASLIAIYTYNGSFRILLTFDEILNVNPKLFIEYIYREIEYVKRNVEIIY